MTVLLLSAALFLTLFAFFFVLTLKHYVFKIVKSNEVSDSIVESLEEVLSSFSERPSHASWLTRQRQSLDNTESSLDRLLTSEVGLAPKLQKAPQALPEWAYEVGHS